MDDETVTMYKKKKKAQSFYEIELIRQSSIYKALNVIALDEHIHEHADTSQLDGLHIHDRSPKYQI